MLTSEQLRKLIVVRLFALDGCKDRTYLYQHQGVLRGLIWALNGRDPGDIHKIPLILQTAKIPHTVDDQGKVWIDENWLKQNKIDPHRW